VRIKYGTAADKVITQINSITYHGAQRARALKSLQSKPCLRLCGLCPDEHIYEQTLPLVNLDSESKDLWEVRRQSYDKDYCIQDINSVPGAYSIMHSGRMRLVVYTDGSCLYPRHRKLAHAGWGVVYSCTDDSLNEHGPVLSIVQTSYRAEVRAVLQVIARCKADVLICSDCKAVVDQVQNYILSGQRNVSTAAPELWEVIYDLLEAACEVDKGHIAIKWVPSHLNDDKKQLSGRNILQQVILRYTTLMGMWLRTHKLHWVLAHMVLNPL